jgi:outer membrane lipoprotein SlyB
MRGADAGKSYRSTQKNPACARRWVRLPGCALRARLLHSFDVCGYHANIQENAMKLAPSRAALGAISLCLLAACQTPSGPNSYSAMPSGLSSGSNLASGYGVVQSIDMVAHETSPITAGTVGGALVGGLLGNQIGQGSGNTAATIAGAAGGALVGRQMEKNMQGGQQDYRVTVRMDNGVLQSYSQSVQPSMRIGDRVQIVNGVVQSY